MTDSFIISLNNGVDSSTKNNEILYKLPTPLRLINHELCLNNMILYYSWYNVTQRYQNSQISYTFSGQTRNLLIPDGNYSISQLSDYIQFAMIGFGDYMIDGNGNNVFFLSIVENLVYYTVTLTLTPVPSTLPAGYPTAQPSGFVYSSTNSTPQLIIPAVSNPATSMSKLLGLNPGAYPSVVQSTEYQINSQFTPVISPVSAVNVSCNLIMNSLYNISSKTIFSFSPTVSFGNQIVIQPSQLIFLQCAGGSYSEISVQLTDQNGNDLLNLDSELLVNLFIRERAK